MDRNFGKDRAAGAAAGSTSSDAWLFAQALLGKPVPNVSAAAADARANREQLAWLAQISPEHERQLRGRWNEEADARAQREQLEWLAAISTEHEDKLRVLLREEAEAREHQNRWEHFSEACTTQEAEWDPAKHPRLGGPPNPGWFASTGGAAGSARSPSFFDAIIRRNTVIGELSGVVTPDMIRSSRFATELQSAAKLPGEVIRAAAAGLGTGGKAAVNGFATAIKSVATLGLSTSQLELIGVTKEDRDRGYDTAVAITTASGQVLIAVGTGGMTSALSKGGAIARSASGVLIAYDATGNAVGVVQGVYDATQNGVHISNGMQVAGGLLGLGANIGAARGLKPPGSAKEAVPGSLASNVDAFVATLPRKATPANSPANLYEIKHAGSYNYTVSGGGESFDIDGYRGTTILEAKHVGEPKNSPYVPGSSCPAPVRRKILEDAREELRKVRTIIESGSTPFKSVEIITNTPEAKKLFEAMLKEMSVPGIVRLKP